MRTVYQLHASGRLHPDTGLDGRANTVSRRAFTERAAADAHIPEFRESCVTPKGPHDMAYMDPASIRIVVAELELD